MPQLDKTGPRGAGAKTGRGMGPCSGKMGFSGRGCRKMGAGFGRGFYSVTGEERKEMLKREAEIIKSDLEIVEKEIESLDK